MARTQADIQKLIDDLQKKNQGLNQYYRTHDYGGRSLMGQTAPPITANIQKIQALEQELSSAQFPTHTLEGAAQTAMEETQKRAAEDRKLALAGVTGRETSALEALRGRETSALGAITGREAPALEAIKEGRTRGLEGFAGTEELLAQARGEVSPEREAMMYEQGRTGIEAGTQAGQRRLQESYARGGAPGGAMMRMMGDVRSAGQGQMSELQRKIQLDRYNKLIGLTGQAGQIAGQKAGIVGQAGRSLADIYGQTGRGLAGVYSQAGRGAADIYGQTGRTLSDIYKSTIAAVPDYSKIPRLQPKPTRPTTISLVKRGTGGLYT